MTLQEWRNNIDLAVELKKLLENPVMQNAISVIDGMSAAKTIGSGSGLIQQASNAHVLFGYDAGRASIISDLEALSTVPEDQPEIEPTYSAEF